jgi:hypothetical protein
MKNLITGAVLIGVAFYAMSPQAFHRLADSVVAQITTTTTTTTHAANTHKWRIEIGPAPICEHQDELGSSATKVSERFFNALDHCHNAAKGTEVTIVKFDERCHSNLINLSPADDWNGNGWTFMSTIKPKAMATDDFIQALVDEGMPCRK